MPPLERPDDGECIGCGHEDLACCVNFENICNDCKGNGCKDQDAACANGTCRTDCGLEGDACCDGGHCDIGTQCVGGTCQVCGQDEGDPCCSGGVCDTGLTCRGGTCSCGLEGEPCCEDGQACGFGLACIDGSCGRVANCNATIVPGGDMADTRFIQLGQDSGTAIIGFNTIDFEDRIQVRYQGVTRFDSGCLGTGSEPLGCHTGVVGGYCCNGGGVCAAEIPYSGSSTFIEVEVIPNCAGTIGTLWEYIIECP